ncbi:MAG: branched-chain amino acid ABC transporter permease [Paracoccaceae bacterium]|nr:branched-chain amino acid ABC transporter permease [Paracoccaceae bacterium]
MSPPAGESPHWPAVGRTPRFRSPLLHAGIILGLIVIHFILPEYHNGNLARIMVLAVYAMGYNILFGYTGLLSLGHALFFAAGMYGLGLPMHLLGATPAPAFLGGLATALVVSAVIGFLALRTSGVAFMIVTLMFAQAGFLTVLLFGEYTRGDEGFVIQQAARQVAGIDLTDPSNRYFAALTLFGVCLLLIAWLVQTPFGRCLVAIRENEERARLLGYDVLAHKLGAVIISGTMSGAAGAAYALLFGYAGATFASVQYSILPLLWVLLGGAGTTIGPFIGTVFMFYLIDLASGVTSAYMLIAGLALVLLTIFAPQGLAGELRRRLMSWLP